MDTTLVFVKTEKGHEEIDRRTYHLNFKHRTALIVVDGENSAEVLLAKIPGDGTALLQDLWRDGFIEPASGNRAAPNSTAATESVVNDVDGFDLETMKRSTVKAIEAILGPNGESLAIGIERTKSRAEFVAQAQKTREVMRAMGGQRRADEFWSKIGL